MMPRTYEPIASQTLGSAAASVTFSSIPGTYTDLRLVGIGATSTTGRNILVEVNSDTANNYSSTLISGWSSSAGSTRQANEANIRGYFQVGTDANVSTYTVDLMSYASTNVNKTLLLTGGHGSEVYRMVGLWRSTSAITAVTIRPNTGNWNSGATFSLFGIKASA